MIWLLIVCLDLDVKYSNKIKTTFLPIRPSSNKTEDTIPDRIFGFRPHIRSQIDTKSISLAFLFLSSIYVERHKCFF